MATAAHAWPNSWMATAAGKATKAAATRQRSAPGVKGKLPSASTPAPATNHMTHKARSPRMVP